MHESRAVQVQDTVYMWGLVAAKSIVFASPRVPRARTWAVSTLGEADGNEEKCPLSRRDAIAARFRSRHDLHVVAVGAVDERVEAERARVAVDHGRLAGWRYDAQRTGSAAGSVSAHSKAPHIRVSPQQTTTCHPLVRMIPMAEGGAWGQVLHWPAARCQFTSDDPPTACCRARGACEVCTAEGRRCTDTGPHGAASCTYLA